MGRGKSFRLFGEGGFGDPSDGAEAPERMAHRAAVKRVAHFWPRLAQAAMRLPNGPGVDEREALLAERRLVENCGHRQNTCKKRPLHSATGSERAHAQCIGPAALRTAFESAATMSSAAQGFVSTSSPMATASPTSLE
jgi:hypothetical protein